MLIIVEAIAKSIKTVIIKLLKIVLIALNLEPKFD